MRNRILAAAIVLLSFALGGLAGAQPTPDHHWPMNEGSGATIVDVIAASNGTLMGGPAWVAGHVGPNALSLDGADDYADLPTGIVSSAAGSFVCWFNTSHDFTGAVGMIFYGSNVTNNDGYGDGEMHLHFEDGADNGRIGFELDGNPDISLLTPLAYNDGQWHQVAVTWDMTGDAIIYLDSTEVIRTSMAAAVNFTATAVVRFGQPGNNSRFLNSALDDVMLFDRALTPIEVVQLDPNAPHGVVDRTLPHVGLFATATTIPVRLTATPIRTGPMVVTETVPAGHTPVIINASAGGVSVVAQTISWTVSMGATPETLDYEILPGAVTQLDWTGLVNAGAAHLTDPITGHDRMIGNVPVGIFDWHGDIGTGLLGAVGGDPSIAGNATLDTGTTYTLSGAGSDIWNGADHGHIAAKLMDGNFILDVFVEWNGAPPDGGSKAGLMVRGSARADAAGAFQFFTSPGGNPTSFEWQPTDGGAGQTVSDRPNNPPMYLRLIRQGTSVSGYFSSDGVNWSLHATATVADLSRSQVLACLAVTSHADDTSGAAPGAELTSAMFSNIVVGQLAVSDAVRDIPVTEYTLGTTISVTIDVGHSMDAFPLVIEETPPAGWTVMSSSTSSTVAGGKITWTIDNFTTDIQLTYEIMPAGGANSGLFGGVVINPGGAKLAIAGDASVNRSGILPVIFIQEGNPIEDQNMVAAIGGAGVAVTLPAPATLPGLGLPVRSIDAVWPEEAVNFTAADGALIYLSHSCLSSSVYYHMDDPLPIINSETAMMDERSNYPRMQLYMSSGADNNSNSNVVTLPNTTHPVTEFWGPGTNVDLTLWNTVGSAQQSRMTGTKASGATMLAHTKGAAGAWMLAYYPAGTDESGLVLPTNLSTYTAPAARCNMGFFVQAFVNPTADGVILFQRVIQFMIGDTPTAGETAPPAAPTNLTLTVLPGLQVRLDWDDNADNEGGYIIARRTGLGNPFFDVGQVKGNIDTYIDGSAQSGKYYTYRVRAFNMVGQSANSNEVSAEDNPRVTATATATSLMLPARETELIGTAIDYFPGGAGNGIKSVTWTLLSSPNASTATIASANALVTTVTLNGTIGNYVFQLAALDLLDNLGAGTVNIVLFDESNLPPTVDAGEPQQIGKPFGAPISVSLAGTAVDPEGQPLTVVWSVIATPQGANASIANPTSPRTGVMLDNVLGDYVFRLTASDGAFDATDDVTIAVIHVEATSARNYWPLLE